MKITIGGIAKITQKYKPGNIVPLLLIVMAVITAVTALTAGTAWTALTAGVARTAGTAHTAWNARTYVTPCIGSRNDNTTIYWLDGNVQVVCGCFRGDLDDFEARVREVHSDSKYGKEYQIAIELAKCHIDLS